MKIRVINGQTGMAEYIEESDLLYFRQHGKMPAREIVLLDDVIDGEVVENTPSINPIHAVLRARTAAWVHRQIANEMTRTQRTTEKPNPSKKHVQKKPSDPTMFEPC